MKKKVIKELNGLFTDNKKIDSINYVQLRPNENIIEVGFNLEEKKQKPEWIRIIGNNDDRYITINMLYKVISWIYDNPIVKNDLGNKYAINNTKWQPATKAEIEAHKLGFHVGDEVWLKNQKLGKLSPIINFFFDEAYGLCARFKSSSFESLKNLTKTPPKQPIFQIDGKDMFEGDEYWPVYKNHNWWMEKRIVGSDADFFLYNDKDVKLFTTKQDALNYVLEEAKRRFDGSLIKLKNTSIGKKYKYTEPIYRNGSIRCGVINVWTEKEGWIAEPIKEPKLMLGNEVVTIGSHLLDNNANEIISIYAKGGSVTKEEWLEWYNAFVSILKHKILEAELKLGEYRSYVVNDGKPFVNFGCDEGIHDATFEQIEAITKSLQEC